MNQTAALRDILTAVDVAPPQRNAADAGLAQSLWQGDAGTALLHCELAANSEGSRATAHAWITAIASHRISANPASGMFAGAPAIAFVLSAAGDRYPDELDLLLKHTVDVAHHRLDIAHERIHSGKTATFAEFDVLRGLTGIGRLLLRCRPGDDATARILEYLVALTKPITIDGCRRPGWWVGHDPDPVLPTPAGHDNLGLAHGIAGPLALLAIAHREGITVDGQTEAIEFISQHITTQTIHNGQIWWWPQWVTGEGTHPHTVHPPRPSWCYGTPGIARALQMGAIATGDTPTRRLAEDAAISAVTAAGSLNQLTESGLCHGWAGTYLTTWHIAHDMSDHRLSSALSNLVNRFATSVDNHSADPSLLDGTTGAALAACHALTDATSSTGWEQCLLLN